MRRYRLADKIEVFAQGSTYPVYVGEKCIQDAGKYLYAYKGKKAAIITDDNVGPLLAGVLSTSLEEGGIACVLFCVPAGEKSKSHEQLLKLYDGLLQAHFMREDVIIALGGGVIGDLAGYCAATYLRGIALVQIPTTLLAQVDSSVGGKTAVNMPQGKNLIGCFYQPNLVLCDTELCKTLPQRELLAGLAEVVKYGCIADAALFTQLEQDAVDLKELVLRCCAIKAGIIQKDTFDREERLVLNFGHTFAHALEKFSDYSLLHGEAVAIGMVIAAKWGEGMGMTQKGTSLRIENLLRRIGLPTQYRCDDLGNWIVYDKKNSQDGLHLVLLEQLGRARIVTFSYEQFLSLLKVYR